MELNLQNNRILKTLLKSLKEDQDWNITMNKIKFLKTVKELVLDN